MTTCSCHYTGWLGHHHSDPNCVYLRNKQRRLEGEMSKPEQKLEELGDITAVDRLSLAVYSRPSRPGDCVGGIYNAPLLHNAALVIENLRKQLAAMKNLASVHNAEASAYRAEVERLREHYRGG